ncbi:hypothetical protein BJX68DRAFT_269612 [Aspergillus pseudodeflectus]|uniref:Uncharacterized protein n=1 Tax=Aspergillus pseudodeflectus TaxID=176178 RepID=A0ABR4JX57_9EURO
MDPDLARQGCQNYALSPLRIALDLLVCLLVVGSFIPQIIRIAVTDRSSDAGISGWYMVLLTLSATSHLATVLGTLFTKGPMVCVREGYLRGWQAFSALGMVVQSILHWACAMALLAVYLHFRHGRGNGSAGYVLVQDDVPHPHYPIGIDPGPDTPLLERLIAGDQQQTVLSSPAMYGSGSGTSSPSNRAILAVVITHAVITLPFPIYIFLAKLPLAFGDDITHLLAAQVYYIVLAFAGFFTSVTAVIPQIHLMVSRSRSGLDLGNLSVLGTGLQCLALFALGASQWVKFAVFDPTHGNSAGLGDWFWTWFRYSGASPVGYLILGLEQLVVFCVALGIGGGRETLHW